MFVEFVNAAMLRELPPCAECSMPATEGRHTSPSPDVPCRDGFPAGPNGCANPALHHLYQLPVEALATQPIEEGMDWHVDTRGSACACIEEEHAERPRITYAQARALDEWDRKTERTG